MSPTVQALSEKIESLDPEQVTEVSDFVDFLRVRTQDRNLTRSAMRLSEPSLNAVWNNPEDAAYDAL